MEIWKPVVNFENRYEVSNFGRVRGIFICNACPEPKMLTTSICERGYAKIYLVGDNGKKLTTRVHILVCKAFHGLPPTHLHTVNHKDGNKLNNIPENLEWMTPKEQMVHAYHVLGKTSTRPRGHGNHWCANYTDEEIKLIRKLHCDGLGYHKICHALGNKTSWVAIQLIITGKTYTHVPN